MASTTYEHSVDTNKMYAAQRRFRDFTKTFCDFVKANKIDHLGNVTIMVRNTCCDSSVLSFVLGGEASTLTNFAVSVVKI